MIRNYKTVLHYLLLPQGVEFYEKVRENLQETVVLISLLPPAWNKLVGAINALSAAFKRAKKYVETAELVALDYDRDGLIKRIVDMIKGANAHPVNEAEKAAAALLMPIVETYLGAAYKEYEAESAYVTHFVNELLSPANSEALATLNLLPLVMALQTKNNTFKSTYTKRMKEMEKNRTEGTTRDFYNAANKALAEFTEAVTGMLRLQVDAATKANLNQIVFMLNALIDQYTIIYHRHAGVIASHNNNDGEGGGDGEGGEPGEGGDGEGGETPGGGTENPDIENPPPPPFLPDFE